MAVYSGKDGSIVFGNNAQTRVRNWSVQTNVDMLEVTDLGDEERNYSPGLKSATGSATIMYHDDNATLRNMLNTSITGGTPSAARLELRWGTRDLDFDAYINSVSISCSTGEIMTADVSFTMTGDYTSLDL